METPTKEVAIFGGTFDPPTKAHEAIIKACLDRDDMDEVWVMPSATRTDKRSMLNDTDRLNMLRLMHEEVFGFDTRLKISWFEIDYMPRPTQTWRTIEGLRKYFPEHTFHFVFGTDSYYTMPGWKRGEQLQRTLGMLLVRRNGDVMPDADNIRELVVPECGGVSSTEVRERVAKSQKIGNLVCNSVYDYIRECQLYLPILVK